MSPARKKQQTEQSRRDQVNARQRALADQQAAQRRKERRLLAVIVSVVVVVLVGGGIGLQAWRANRAPQADSVTPGQISATVTITAGHPVSWGSAGAPVTIDLYSDFHCPHCAEFEEQYGQTLTDAQEAGQITLRIFPMAFIDTQRSHEDWVNSINDAASAAGVTGTPTMFLDGQQVDLTTVTPDGLKAQIAEAAQQ